VTLLQRDGDGDRDFVNVVRWLHRYDRRGRGDSTDTQPYDVQREIEDIQARVAEAGGSAHLYGVSSGGRLRGEAPSRPLILFSSAVDRFAGLRL
jgi:hypothetical protein